MPSILLDKPFNEAADGMMKFVTNATRTLQDVELAGGTVVQEIVVEGDFERFVLSLMDTWGGRLRFVFRDTEAKDEEAIKTRGEIAMLNPQIAHMMTAKANLRVYRRDLITIETIRRCGRQELSRETREEEDWPEVTEEFGRLMQREALLAEH